MRLAALEHSEAGDWRRRFSAAGHEAMGAIRAGLVEALLALAGTWLAVIPLIHRCQRLVFGCLLLGCKFRLHR